jgi:hypothetical protein
MVVDLAEMVIAAEDIEILLRMFPTCKGEFITRMRFKPRS